MISKLLSIETLGTLTPYFASKALKISNGVGFIGDDDLIISTHAQTGSLPTMRFVFIVQRKDGIDIISKLIQMKN